jgi:signal transduction histidine kinase/sugar phosphate isomerase/epimerase
MKIGFQTIVWSPFRDPLEYRLEVIAAAGYGGVVFRERPDELPPIHELLRFLEEYSLKLIGLSGGALRDRMDYCQDFRPEYLYVDDWSSDAGALAQMRGFTLALHPHVYKPTYSLQRAGELLEREPSLKFVPDTAHLTIAGDDPVAAMERFEDRIAAVNLRDWASEFGYSVHRYGRGFVELGRGIIDLDRVLAALQKTRYSGWLVVEQDYTRTDPAMSTLKCAEWLAERGLASKPPPKPPAKPRAPGSARTGGSVDASFLETMTSAGWRDPESCYESIARGIRKLCDCELVTFWTCSPAHELVNLVAVEPTIGISPKNVVAWRETLTGLTIEEQTIKHFDLADREVRSRFGWPELLQAVKSGWMTSIPIFNPWNPNHVRLIVNLLHERKNLPVPDSKLNDVAATVGYSTSYALDEFGLTLAARLNACAGKMRHVRDLGAEVVTLVERTMHCGEVAMFVRRDTGNKLELVGFAGDTWEASQVAAWYVQREKSIKRVLEQEQRFVVPRDWWAVTGQKNQNALVEQRACTAVPLVASDGAFLGYLCCGARRGRGAWDISERTAFSDDDDAILEALVQAVVPHLEVLMAHERREKALGRLTHELKVPIVAIRGATEMIMRTVGARRALPYDYPGDIWSWSELMGRLIDNADMARYHGHEMELRQGPTRILADVIAPSIRQVTLLLDERGFSHRRISYDNDMLRQFPLLQLDRNRFQQVLFNLLSNAIKYAYEDPDAFQVEIDGVKNEDGFVIWFRDWGMGLKQGTEESIFEEGYRGDNAREMNVTGEGLGLWIARQIVEAHGGTIEPTNHGLPTEFRILLPRSLAEKEHGQTRTAGRRRQTADGVLRARD